MPNVKSNYAIDLLDRQISAVESLVKEKGGLWLMHSTKASIAELELRQHEADLRSLKQAREAASDQS